MAFSKTDLRYYLKSGCYGCRYLSHSFGKRASTT
jgi:hypothetical protein